MSQGNNEIGNTEYYLEVDDINRRVSVMKYVFDTCNPNGAERKLLSIRYTRKSGYTLEQCKCLCERLCSMLESTDWRKENNVYK